MALTPDSVTSIITALSKQQRIDLLLETKRLAQTNPEAARQLLLDHPPLTHVLVQLQLLYGLITAEEIMQLIVQQPPPPPMQQPAPAPPPQPVPAPYPMQPLQPMGMPPMGYGPPMPIVPSPEEILARLPPLPPQQREIVVELLKLTPEELRGLPQEAQQQVKDILTRIGIGR